jgi:uncharacterized membrane protein YfcA
MPIDTVCPNCSSGDTQAVKMLVHLGTSSSVDFHTTGSAGMVGASSSQSSLAAKYSVPDKQSMKFAYWLMILGLAGAVLSLGLTAARVPPRELWAWGFFVCFVVLVLGGMIHGQQYRTEKKYGPLRERYEKLWVCKKCGHEWEPQQAAGSAADRSS